MRSEWDRAVALSIILLVMLVVFCLGWPWSYPRHELAGLGMVLLGSIGQWALAIQERRRYQQAVRRAKLELRLFGHTS